MSTAPYPIPRVPVFGWAALTGRRTPPTPTLLDLPGMYYSTSGRASILLALETLGIGAGDRVLMPTYHCPTMVAPAVERGVELTFYPIDERGSPDLAWLNSQDLGRTRALLVAHYFGLPQALAVLRRWCDDKGIALIEDCAHALFGRSGERSMGTWGDVAIGSLTKFLPVSEGGCLVLNNGREPPVLSPCGLRTQFKVVLDIIEEGARHGRLLGFNSLVTYTMTALRGLREVAPRATGAISTPAKSESSCAINVALAHRTLSRPNRWIATHLPLERIVRRRRRNYERLAQVLTGHTGLRPLFPLLPPDCAPYMFPIWVDHPDAGYAELRRLQMPVLRWDRVWPGVPGIAGDQGPYWSHHVLQLACHQDLHDSELERFTQRILTAFSNRPGPLMPSPLRTSRFRLDDESVAADAHAPPQKTEPLS